MSEPHEILDKMIERLQPSEGPNAIKRRKRTILQRSKRQGESAPARNRRRKLTDAMGPDEGADE